MEGDDLDEQAAGWLDNKALDGVERYVRSGRPHRGLGTAELKRRWVGQFSLWTRDLGDVAARRRHEAMQAELRLRGEEPPYDRVPDALDRLLGEVRRRIDAMSPDQAHRVNTALERSMAEFYDMAAAARH